MYASVERLLIQITTSIAHLTVADSFVVVKEIAHTNVCCKTSYSMRVLWYMCLYLIATLITVLVTLDPVHLVVRCRQRLLASVAAKLIKRGALTPITLR
jgi:hypothetical protein